LVNIKTIWSILLPYGILYRHLVHLWSFWHFIPALVCCTKKNLATLTDTSMYVPISLSAAFEIAIQPLKKREEICS
jgi:hypothetical protein